MSLPCSPSPMGRSRITIPTPPSSRTSATSRRPSKRRTPSWGSPSTATAIASARSMSAASRCWEVLPQMLKKAGLEPVMWKTGHSFIKQKMKEIGAPLAGEMSGHMFFGGDWYGFDDALFAAARLLAYVAREGGPLSRRLADLPRTFATPELRVDCPDERKFAIVEQAARHFATRYPVATL